MTISVKKIFAISMAISILSVAGCTLVLRTLILSRFVGSIDAETIYGPIKLVTKLDKNMFSLGEEINVNVTITNISNETILLVYSTGLSIEFAVYDSSSKLIYAPSLTMGFPGVFVDISLEPSELYGLDVKWDQQKMAGEYTSKTESVDSGTYYIAGRVGEGLCYLGPKDEYQDDIVERLTVETPKIEIQIL